MKDRDEESVCCGKIPRVVFMSASIEKLYDDRHKYPEGTRICFRVLSEGGCMGYTKKTLQELDLIDNFLSNAIASNQEINEPFYRLLLSVLLGKDNAFG